jgi:hypothetical protein
MQNDLRQAAPYRGFCPGKRLCTSALRIEAGLLFHCSRSAGGWALSSLMERFLPSFYIDPSCTPYSIPRWARANRRRDWGVSAKDRIGSVELRVEHLHLRAKQCRAIAAASPDADRRTKMYELALDYEHLAERLVATARAQNTPPSLSARSASGRQLTEAKPIANNRRNGPAHDR